MKTPAQERFVAEFLIDQNASRAYRAAFGPDPSYRTCRRQGSLLLKDPVVREAVREGLAAARHKARVSAERVLAETAAVAFFDPGEAFAVKDGEMVARPLADMPPAARRVIAAVRIKRRIIKSDGVTTHLTEDIDYKFASKLDALDKLCKHLNLYAEREPLDQFLARLPAALGEALRQAIVAGLPAGGGTASLVAVANSGPAGGPGEFLAAPPSPLPAGPADGARFGTGELPG